MDDDLSRFLIEWDAVEQVWSVDDTETSDPVVQFDSLLAAETYVIERSERSER